MFFGVKGFNLGLKRRLKALLGAGSAGRAAGSGGKTEEAQAGKGLLDLVWRVEEDGRRQGTWWWWFWLFFFENKGNPLQPKQLMILWSTKDDPEIDCNGKLLKLRPERVEQFEGKALLDGAVAAWFYDGEKMRENFLLEQCDISVDARTRELRTNSGSGADRVKTSFSQEGDVFKTVIEKGAGKAGERLEFSARLLDGNDFAVPTLGVKKFFAGKFDYRILRINRLGLKCRITQGGKTEESLGSAYFQKVTVNAPAVPWHWAIAHFANGSSLSYFAPHVGISMLESNLLRGVATQSALSRANKALSKELRFFDAKSRRLHVFRNLKIRSEKNAGDLPAWRVRASNDSGETLVIGLNSYSEAAWKFRKRVGKLPVKSSLHYNEYPVHVDQFELRAPGGAKILSLKDVGEGFGNAEHSWGFLI